ncbi:MAG: PAS domain-containing sensor histidine kinase [Planctomycetes bacterium]|nr:PAS domain-containing sensor histidine kinase [Planctomycetota bacterium]
MTTIEPSDLLDPYALLELLECAPCGMLVLSLDGRIVLQNRTASLLLGSMPSLLEEAGPDLEESPLALLLADVVAEVSQMGFALPRQADLELGSGATLPVGVSGSLLRRDEQGPDHVVVVIQDMTPNRELARRDERERDRRTILTLASHEIRNSMSGVLGYLELMLDGEENPRRRRYLEKALREGSLVMTLVRDLLDASRLEGKSVELNLAETDVGQLVEDVADVLRLIKPDASIRLRIQPGLPLVYADGGRLARAIRNLVDNAIKYSPRGADVRIDVQRHDTVLEVSVSDKGMGIAAEDQPRVFEQFYRSEVSQAVRRLPGSGIGLSVVKAIAEAHGGTVRLSSRLGDGSSFSLRVPIEGPSSARRTTRVSARFPRQSSELRP